MGRRSRATASVLAAVAISSIFVMPGTRAQTPEPDQRPNVLIVVTDDQRVATMRVMRRTRRLLEEGGVSFPRAFVTTPQCCPSRASIFSGTYAHNHGVHSNQEGGDLDEDRTMQAYLDAAGYNTGMVGKYLNGVALSHNPPHFDKYAVRGSLRFYDSPWNVNGGIKTKRGYDTHVTRRLTTNFLRSFEANDDAPWFMYVAPIAPHLPARPEERFRDARIGPRPTTPAMHEDDISDKPQFIQESPRRRGPQVAWTIRRQMRSLMSVDVMVSSLVSKLSDLGERSRTLIIFTSDNGYMWRDHGIGGKGLPYTPAVHVPMLLRWNGHFQAGTRDERLAANIDIAPTVLDAADVEPGHEMDGRSLIDPSWTRDHLLLEHWGWEHPAWSSIITPDYQYTEWADAVAPGVPEPEYYDLVADPWQLRNLFGDADPTNDPEVATLSAQLAADRQCQGTNPAQGGCP